MVSVCFSFTWSWVFFVNVADIGSSPHETSLPGIIA